MTPKEKAQELVNKYFKEVIHFPYIDTEDGNCIGTGCMTYLSAKQCALTAVDEIINSEPRNPSDVDWEDIVGTHQYYYEVERKEAVKFWQEVKQEIEKL